MADKKELSAELIRKQRKVSTEKYHLSTSDICRLCKYIDKSIFNEDDCILWSGYLTNCNGGKSKYINFYLKGKKLAIHRILYINFVGDLKDSQYLKYTCNNSGKCCNINHFYRVDEDEKEDLVDEIITLPVQKIGGPEAIKSSLKLIFSD